MSSTFNATPTVADAIEHTLEWLDKQGCAPPARERRTTGRSRFRVIARIIYHPPGDHRARGFDVPTRNLSRTGLSFLHKTLIYPPQLVRGSVAPPAALACATSRAASPVSAPPASGSMKSPSSSPKWK